MNYICIVFSIFENIYDETNRSANLEMKLLALLQITGEIESVYSTAEMFVVQSTEKLDADSSISAGSPSPSVITKISSIKKEMGFVDLMFRGLNVLVNHFGFNAAFLRIKKDEFSQTDRCFVIHCDRITYSVNHCPQTQTNEV